MADPRFLFVSAPSALSGTPSGWARDMLAEGKLALLGAEGIEAVDAVAHDLGQTAVTLIRTEPSGELQDETVITHAGSLPTIWVSRAFSEPVQEWARARGPMTLLSESIGALDEDERRRIDRFVAILGRQSE